MRAKTKSSSCGASHSVTPFCRVDKEVINNFQQKILLNFCQNSIPSSPHDFQLPRSHPVGKGSEPSCGARGDRSVCMLCRGLKCFEGLTDLILTGHGMELMADSMAWRALHCVAWLSIVYGSYLLMLTCVTIISHEHGFAPHMTITCVIIIIISHEHGLATHMTVTC